MCKIVCELCVGCDYDFGYTNYCDDFDASVGMKADLTRHMNRTKDTSTNEIMFLLCRRCAPMLKDGEADLLDDIHRDFIKDVLKNASMTNSAATNVVVNKDGRVVWIMQ
jgi:hypothetical protein